MREDSAFYTYSQDSEIVWQDSENDFYVIRNGEMRINAIDERGQHWIIRYTDQLENFGITNDEQLAKWLKNELMFDWISNPWFEVCRKSDSYWESDVYDNLTGAINSAKLFSVMDSQLEGAL
jgi:hypothetical protein